MQGFSLSSELVKSKESGCLRGQGSKYGQFDNQHGMVMPEGRVVQVRSISSCKILSIRIKLLKHLKTPRQKFLDFNFDFDFSCISSPGKAGRSMHPPASCRSPRPRISSVENWAKEESQEVGEGKQEKERKTTLKIWKISQRVFKHIFYKETF